MPDNQRPTPGPYTIDSSEADIAAGYPIEISGGVPYKEGPGGCRALALVYNADSFANLDKSYGEPWQQAIAESRANADMILAAPYLLNAAEASEALRSHANDCQRCDQYAEDYSCDRYCPIGRAMDALHEYLTTYALSIARGGPVNPAHEMLVAEMRQEIRKEAEGAS